MPLPEQIIINIDTLPVRDEFRNAPKPSEIVSEPTALEPPPFNVDKYLNGYNSTQAIEKTPINDLGFANTFQWLARPFFSQGYNGAAALNRGLAGFSAHLDSIADYIEASTGLKKGELFEDAAQIYEQNAAYWQERADKIGVGFFDELISEAVGAFVPGVTQFSLDIASGFTFPYMAGAAESFERGENPFVGGITEAAKTGVLAGVFRMMAPLKQYLKAPALGTVFGLQEMEGTTEGKGLRSFAKGFGTGVGYSLVSPGGRMGLNEIKKGIEPELAKIREATKKKTEGLTEPIDGKIRQRQFLKTAAESESIDPTLTEKVKGIDPQKYIVQPNAESTAKAEARVERDGIDKATEYFFSTDVSIVDAEKGALGVALIDRFQREGSYDKALEVIKSYDVQAREAGRFIQAISIMNRLTPTGFIRWADKELEKVKSKYSWLDSIFGRKPESFTLNDAEKTEIFKRMSEIGKMPDGPEKTQATLDVISKVAEKVPPSASELIDAYRYQNMLSGPRTQQRNIGENIGNTFITAPIDIVTKGAIDYVKAGKFGKERQAYVSDVPLYLKSAINAVPNAARGFMEVMRLEKGVDIGKPDIGLKVETEFERARAKQIPKSLTIVSRFMEASDKFNSALIGAGEFAIQKKRGVSDAEAYKAASELSQMYLYRSKLDPKDPKLSMFSKALSSLGQMMNESRRKPVLGSASKWIVPFIRTPVNKGIQMIERSPLGLLKMPKNYDLDTWSRQFQGAIATAIGATLAYEGKTTWTPPTDPDEKALWYASGKKAFSFRVGDTWIPAWYLGPYALAFIVPAAVKHYAHDEKQAMSKDWFEKVGSIANGITRFIGSQSSTQSIGTLFEVLSGDIDPTFSSTAAFTAGQMIPLSGLLRFTGTIIDPVYRKPTGFFENIEKNLPFLSQELEARRLPPISGEDPRFMPEAKRDSFNYFVPYDIGKNDKIYDEQLKPEQYKNRETYLNNKIMKLNKKISSGQDIDYKKVFDEMAELVKQKPENIDILLPKKKSLFKRIIGK